MEWNDEGIVLNTRRHGESDLVVSVLTFEHGRHAGLVRAGASRKNWPQWQIGNRLELVWKARIEEQLGSYRAELLEPFAARVIQDPLKLAALASACSMIDATLPERQTYPAIYAAMLHIIRRMDQPDWQSDYVRFELLLLEGLGFGLQLDICALTDTNDNLTHVSPRTGRAVSASAAEPYLDKLLPLPGFLQPNMQAGHAFEINDIAQGLRLAGYFFTRHVFDPADRSLPVARDRLVHLLTQSGDDERP